MTRKEWKAAHRASRIARQKRDAPGFSLDRPKTERRADPLEGLEADLRRLMRQGAAQAAERMALPSLLTGFPLRRALAVIAIVAALVVGLSISRGVATPADAGVTDVSAPNAPTTLPATSPS